MKLLRTVLMFLSLIACLLALNIRSLAQHQHHQEHSQEEEPQTHPDMEQQGDLKLKWLDPKIEQQSPGPSLSLTELEQMGDDCDRVVLTRRRLVVRGAIAETNDLLRELEDLVSSLNRCSKAQNYEERSNGLHVGSKSLRLSQLYGWTVQRGGRCGRQHVHFSRDRPEAVTPQL